MPVHVSLSLYQGKIYLAATSSWFTPTSNLAAKIGENAKFQMSAAIMKGYC